MNKILNIWLKIDKIENEEWIIVKWGKGWVGNRKNAIGWTNAFKITKLRRKSRRAFADNWTAAW